MPVYQEGDVLRRMQVRIDEVRESLRLIRDAAAYGWSYGPYRVPMPPLACRPLRAQRRRGLARRDSSLDPYRPRQPHLERCKIKDPSLNNWPALVEAVQGNIVPDFPGDQQELQSFLFRDGSLSHVQDSQIRPFETGLVTIGYPEAPARISPNASAARRASTSLIGVTRAPPPRHVPRGRLQLRNSGDTRVVTMDYGLCTYCGECAAADQSGAVQMTQRIRTRGALPRGSGDHRRVRRVTAN